MEVLKNCPHCGSADVLLCRSEIIRYNKIGKIHTVSERYEVRCSNCNCGTGWTFYKDVAVSNWNARPEKGEQDAV